MTPFVPGLELAGAYYAEVVRPLLDEGFAGLPHAAALIDAGSEVLGFDSERSTDHDWGPRLPHRPGGGAVYHDGPGDLSRARARLAWYPRDVWLYVMAGQWQRISQEEPFPGRCAEARDDLGSAVVTARLARDLMRLALLMGRRYPPYSKWLGSAFARLPQAAALGPCLRATVAATGWPVREQHLSRAYRLVAVRHNELGVTRPLDPDTRPFFDRPFQVLGAGRFAEALRAEITDPEIRARPLFGAVDGFIDSSDALGHTGFLRPLSQPPGRQQTAASRQPPAADPSRQAA